MRSGAVGQLLILELLEKVDHERTADLGGGEVVNEKQILPLCAQKIVDGILTVGAEGTGKLFQRRVEEKHHVAGAPGGLIALCVCAVIAVNALQKAVVLRMRGEIGQQIGYRLLTQGADQLAV